MPISAEQWRMSVCAIDASRSVWLQVTWQSKRKWNWWEVFLYLTALLVAILVLRGGGMVTEARKSVSSGRNGRKTRWRLVSSLLIAPRRRSLLILAGDVEMNPGPVPFGDRGLLYYYDLDVLVEELSPVQTKWEGLGRVLEVPEKDLEAIRSKSCNPRDSLRKMLRGWLHIVQHWRDIVDALRSIGEDRLSSELKVKYGLLDEVEGELDRVSTKWYLLGQNLLGKWDRKKLDTIRTKYNNPEDCLREVISYWLDTYRYYTNWSTIVAALRGSIDSQLADHLEAKYCSGLLHESDLDVIVNELSSVSTKWESLANQLGRHDLLSEIHTKYSDPTVCLREYIRLWLQYGLPTWNHIVLALKCPDVGASHLGDHLREKYYPGLDLEGVDGTTVLNEDDLPDVRLAVADLSGRWQDLGVSLGICQGDLEAILSDNSHSSSDCLKKVLTLWLRQSYKVERFGKPTWRRLVEAVEDHVGGNNVNLALAQKIAREHPVYRVALEREVKKERMMPLCIAQCMAVGAPQTGKSSLKRRLLKQTSRPSMSTGVAEKPVVCAVTVDGSEWTVLQWEEEGVQFLQGIKQLPSKENPETNQLPRPSISIPEDTEDSFIPRDESPSAVEKPEEKNSQPVDVSTDNFSQQHPSSNSEGANMEVDMNLNEPEPSSYSELIDTILDVGSEKWIAAKKRLENQCTIYFTDTGGQLEFQEVLPVIISGPSIFLLVFNLEHAAEGLDKEFPAVYKRSDGSVYEPPHGMSTFTVRDLILQVLASIQSTRSYQFQKDGNEQVIEAKVLLVGTHSDRVTDASVRNRIESDMQKLLKYTPYYQKGMLQVPCRKRRNEKFVYMVNNESLEDPVFQEIREKVESLIFKKSGVSNYKENISSHWLGFDLMLRWPGKFKILKYQHCVDLARRCGIKEEDDVKKALTFLHERFGIIRYFKGKSLGHIVITNPQVIYNMLSNLIAEQFQDSDSDSNCSLTPEQVEEFQDKGLISEDAVRRITSQWSETHDLGLQFLLNLLGHLHIVVKLEGDEFDPETKYFIPCVLAGTIYNLSTPEDISEPIVADLLILFDHGRQYCPKGLFSVFVIKLAQKPKQDEAKYTWVLNRKKLSREGVVFHVKVMDSGCRYSYTVHIQHGLVGSQSTLRIFIEKLYGRSSREQVCCVCKEIRDSVKSAIKSSLNELHKSTELCIGFYSTCDKNQTSSESHIAIVEDLFQEHSGVPEDMTCIDCRNKSCPLEEEHKVWFKEVPQELDPRLQGDQPTLMELIRFRGRERRINIPQQIGINFMNFGILLLEDENGARIQSIVRECRGNPEEISMKVLQEWIVGQGKLPVSWDTLIEVLRDIDLGTLADDIAAVK